MKASLILLQFLPCCLSIMLKPRPMPEEPGGRRGSGVQIGTGREIFSKGRGVFGYSETTQEEAEDMEVSTLGMNFKRDSVETTTTTEKAAGTTTTRKSAFGRDRGGFSFGRNRGSSGGGLSVGRNRGGGGAGGLRIGGKKEKEARKTTAATNYRKTTRKGGKKLKVRRILVMELSLTHFNCAG